MPDTPNLAVVRKFYDSLRAPATIAPLLSPSIRYEITPGFPHSGIFIGLDAIVGDFFTPLMEDFVDWQTEPSEFHESGDRVFTIGLYLGAREGDGQVLHGVLHSLVDARRWPHHALAALRRHLADRAGFAAVN